MKRVKRLLAGSGALCLGLLLLSMYISTVWLLSVTSILDLRQSYALADRIRQTKPASWVALPTKNYTGSVLLQGRPSQYLSESSSLRTNGAYDTDQISKPDFNLQGPSESVRVTNGCVRQFNGMFGKLKNIRHTMNLGDGCYRLGDDQSSASSRASRRTTCSGSSGGGTMEPSTLMPSSTVAQSTTQPPWKAGPGYCSSPPRSVSGS